MNLPDYAIDAGVTIIAAIIATTWPPSMDAIAALPVLGIPLAALSAAMLGSGFSYLRRSGQDVEAAPLRLLGISADAFLGGWIAVSAIHATPLHQYGIQAVPIEAIAGLLAFVMQVIRKNTMTYFDRAFQTVLNAVVGIFTRGKSATKDPGEAP